MRVERDIAGIVLPFAAGVVLATCTGHAISMCPHLTITIVYIVILGSAAFLLHPIHRSCSSASVRSVIGICLCFCGILYMLIIPPNISATVKNSPADIADTLSDFPYRLQNIFL